MRKINFCRHPCKPESKTLIVFWFTWDCYKFFMGEDVFPVTVRQLNDIFAKYIDLVKLHCDERPATRQERNNDFVCNSLTENTLY